MQAERNHSERSPAFSAAYASITLTTIAGQVLGLVRESSIAAEFGATGLTDSFLLAILIPNGLVLLIQNGVAMAFIPVLAETIATSGEARAWDLVRNLLFYVALAGVVLLASMLAAADWLVTLLAPNLPIDLHDLTVSVFRTLSPITILGTTGALLAAVANAYRSYVVPALFGVVFNLATIAAIIVLSDSLSVYALVVGSVGAYFLQVVVLLFSLRRVQKFSLRSFRVDKSTLKVLRLSWPPIVTLLMQQAVVLAERVIAVGMGAGSVSALNFASRLVFVVPPLLVGGITTVVLPEMARTLADGDVGRARSDAISVLKFSVFVAMPCMAILFVLREPVTKLAFQRGAFTEAASDLTATVVAYYVVVLVAGSLREVIVRLFYAAHDTVTPMASAIARMTVNIALSVVLAQWIGIEGIALGYSIALCLDVAIMGAFVMRKWQLGFGVNYLAKVSLATLAVLLVAGWLSVEMRNPIGDQLLWHQVRRIAVSALGGGITYLAVCGLLEVGEVKTLVASMARSVAWLRSRPGDE